MWPRGEQHSDTMVLSMLSAIQCVKQISQGGPGGGGAPSLNSKLDMSRRKQRNPKPIFSPSEEDGEAAENHTEVETRDSRSDSEGSNGEADSDNPIGDIGDMVKVEVDEEERGGGVAASSPPRHMGPTGPQMSPSGARPEMVFPSVEDIMRKCNMFQFGEVSVLNHPNTPPVPMAIPMTYLYPMSRDSVTGEAKYKMLVPFNNPEMSMGVPPPMIPFPSPPLVPQLHLPSAPPQIRPEESLQKKPKQVSLPAKPPQTPNRSIEQKAKIKKDETGTGPLDLTQKSPNSSRSDIEEDLSKDESILPDRHSPNIPLLKLEPTTNKEEDSSSFSPRLPTSPRDLPRISTSGDLETQLNFLKVKHLEFLKASGATANVNRCNECNINFSKYPNYVAHKKYYCTGIKQPAPSDSDDDSSQSSTKLETALGGRSADRDSAPASSTSATSPLPTPPSLAQAFEAGINKDIMNRELLLKQQELMGKEALQAVLLQQVGRDGGPGLPLLLPTPGPPLQLPTSHFTCEGCGIKFKSVNNLQAHQARYCAGIRKAEEATAMEALMKRSGGQLMPGPSAADMISFLNARQVMENQATQENNSTEKSPRTQPEVAASGSASSGSSPSEDFCCILCGYKESSVDRLKDHINMHFIGQIKKRKAGSDLGISASGTQDRSAPSPSLSPRDDIAEPEVKKIKRESETEETSPPAPQQKPTSTKVNGSNHNAETVPSSSDPDTEEGSPRSPGDASGGDQQVLPVKCNNCDISFMHISTFIAHQKYYCRGNAASMKQE